MNTTIKIASDEEHEAGLARLDELWGSPRDSDEGRELRALAKALQDYQDEHWWPITVQTDPALHFEVRLDAGFSTLEELLPLFGGMDVFCKFMIREHRLDDETIDRLVANLGLGLTKERMHGAYTEPAGWEYIEELTDGEDWRADMLAYRDAKAAESAEGTNRDAQDMQDDVATREPELVAT